MNQQHSFHFQIMNTMHINRCVCVYIYIYNKSNFIDGENLKAIESFNLLCDWTVFLIYNVGAVFFCLWFDETVFFSVIQFVWTWFSPFCYSLYLLLYLKTHIQIAIFWSYRWCWLCCSCCCCYIRFIHVYFREMNTRPTFSQIELRCTLG